MFRSVINIYVLHRLLLFPHFVHWVYMLHEKEHESFPSSSNPAVRMHMLVSWDYFTCMEINEVAK